MEDCEGVPPELNRPSARQETGTMRRRAKSAPVEPAVRPTRDRTMRRRAKERPPPRRRPGDDRTAHSRRTDGWDNGRKSGGGWGRWSTAAAEAPPIHDTGRGALADARGSHGQGRTRGGPTKTRGTGRLGPDRAELRPGEDEGDAERLEDEDRNGFRGGGAGNAGGGAGRRGRVDDLRRGRGAQRRAGGRQGRVARRDRGAGHRGQRDDPALVHVRRGRRAGGGPRVLGGRSGRGGGTHAGGRGRGGVDQRGGPPVRPRWAASP